MKTLEDMINKGNKIEMTCHSKVLHEVRIYGKNGKLKKTISEKRIKERHWEQAEEQSRNRRFHTVAPKKGNKYASARKVQKSFAIEQFEDEEFYGV